jgi:hypothetical protein
MRFFSVGLIVAYLVNVSSELYCLNDVSVQNNCVEFSVASGTGCQWMCNFCEQMLGTTNYYFTDGICMYQTGGCVGNPQAGVKYTCCSN